MHRLALALAIGGAVASTAGCEGVRAFSETIFQPDLRSELSNEDIAMAVGAMQSSLENSADGVRVEWSNATTGNGGAVWPTDTFQTDAGYFCRDFSEEVRVAERMATYQNTACRNDDGTWRLISS